MMGIDDEGREIYPDRGDIGMVEKEVIEVVMKGKIQGWGW